MVVTEELVLYFIYPVTTASVIANLALIFIIVGAYRFLLLSFAVVDILISTVHFIVVPAVQMTEFGFIFFGFRFIRDSMAVGFVTDLVFITLFYQTFVLLAFHYVYRYVLICDPSWLRWVGVNHKWRNWISMAIAADLLYILGFLVAINLASIPNDTTREAFAPMLQDAHNIDLFASNRPGYIGMAYRLKQADGSYSWCPRSIVAILLVFLLFFGSGIVIVFCIWKVREAMRKTKVHLATRTLYLQNQLFRTLLIQTLVPTVTSYIPLSIVFVMPILGWSLGGFGTVAVMSTALFPLIDPFLVVFLVSGYRARLPPFIITLMTSSVRHSAAAFQPKETRNPSMFTILSSRN